MSGASRLLIVSHGPCTEAGTRHSATPAPLFGSCLAVRSGLASHLVPDRIRSASRGLLAAVRCRTISSRPGLRVGELNPSHLPRLPQRWQFSCKSSFTQPSWLILLRLRPYTCLPALHGIPHSLVILTSRRISHQPDKRVPYPLIYTVISKKSMW